MSQPDPLHDLHHVEEEEDVNSEIWLISYADMMTLLFGFFVVLYSFAAAKGGSGIELLKQNLAQEFQGKYEPPLKDLATAIEKGVKQIPVLADVKVVRTSDGVVLSFQDAILFPSSRAELIPDAHEALDQLIQIILKEAPGNPVLVEGHTDHRPIKTARYPSNWELSSARAARVLRLFIDRGKQARELTAIGYGSARPLYPNRDPQGELLTENMHKNRRVVIKVLIPKHKKFPN